MIRMAITAIVIACYGIAPAAGETKNGFSSADVRETIETVCSACHGIDGNSTVPSNPVLAGQDAAYLFKQLKEFRSTDGKPAVRGSPVMTAITTTLNDAEMKALARYFSQQATASAAPADAKPAAMGRDLWRKGHFERGIPACTGCHGPTGAGVPPQYPRLAGQHAEYTELQLKNFDSEERSNDKNRTMQMVAGKLSGKQITALADYIASLRQP